MKMFRAGLFIFGLFVLMVGYQNCARTLAPGDAASKDLDATQFWFDKSSTEHSLVYSDFYFFRPEEGSGNLGQYEIFGMVVPIEGFQGTVQYNLQLKNESGGLVCPTKSGNLTAANSRIAFTCSGWTSAGKVFLLLEGQLPSGDTFEVSREFAVP